MTESTVARLIFAALSILLAIYVAITLWNATFGTDAYDLDQFRQRIDFMMCSDGSPLDQYCAGGAYSQQYKTNSFLLGVEPGRAIIFFRADRDFEGVYSMASLGASSAPGRPPWDFGAVGNPRVIPNPCPQGTACVCEINLDGFTTSPRTCFPFKQDAIFVTPGQHQFQLVQGRWIYAARLRESIPEMDYRILYPEFVFGDERRDVYPAIFRFIDTEQVHFFIEYLPPTDQIPLPRILIAPMSVQDVQGRSYERYMERRSTFDPDSYRQITPVRLQNRYDLQVTERPGGEIVVSTTGEQRTYRYSPARTSVNPRGELTVHELARWEYGRTAGFSTVSATSGSGAFREIDGQLSRMGEAEGRAYLRSLHEQTVYVELDESSQST